jgi:hypothetical protein
MSWSFVRLAGLTLANVHLEHPEEPDDRIKGVVPMREAALNILPDAVLKHAFSSLVFRPIFTATLRQHLELKPGKTEQNGSVATLSFQ